MHPYRDASPSEPERDSPASEPGPGLAFGVMTVVGAVQVAIALPHSGLPSLQTVFGGACFIAGVAWLVRHRDR